MSTLRPSPTDSATLYSTGTKKKGNDGNIWVVTKTSTGTKRWTKTKSKDDIFMDKYNEHKRTHKKLRMSDIRILEPGDKIKLCLFQFGTYKKIKFTFTFKHITVPKANQKKHIQYFIFGNSTYTGEYPLFVTTQTTKHQTKGDIKFAMSSDESVIFLE